MSNVIQTLSKFAFVNFLVCTCVVAVEARQFETSNLNRISNLLLSNLGTRTGTLENTDYPCHATVEKDIQGKNEFLVEAGWSAFEFPGVTSTQWSVVTDGRYLLAETFPSSTRKGVRVYFEIDSSSGRFTRSIRKDKAKKGKSQICELY